MKCKRSGAALLMTIMMIALISFALIAAQHITNASVRNYKAKEHEIRRNYAVESLLAYITTAEHEGAITIPTVVVRMVGDVRVTASVTDNNAVLRDTFKAVMTLEMDGRTYTEEAIAHERGDFSPWFYAVFATSELHINANLTVTGSVYFEDILDHESGTVSITGDLETPMIVDVGSIATTGVEWLRAPDYDYATDITLTYWANRDRSANSGTIESIAFASADELLYVTSGDPKLEGTFSGQGTLYRDGKVEMEDDMLPADGSSRLNVVATGDIEFETGTYYGNFCAPDDRIVIEGPGLVTIYGSIVAAEIHIHAPLVVIHDTYIRDNPNRARDWHLPGHWPSFSVVED